MKSVVSIEEPHKALNSNKVLQKIIHYFASFFTNSLRNSHYMNINKYIFN